MCSRKWLTPAISPDSSREPVSTKKPTAVECASPLHSATISSPFASVCLRKSNGHLQFVRSERDDREIFWRMLRQILADALARQRVDQRADLVQGPHAAQVVPVAGHGRA